MGQGDEDGSTHGGCLIDVTPLVRVEPGKMEKLESSRRAVGTSSCQGWQKSQDTSGDW